MSWLRTFLLLLCSSPVWALEGYIIGGGVQADSADGVGVSLVGDFGLTEVTWLSMGLGRSSVDVRADLTMETLYADIGIDHWFNPIGFRAGLAYWGDDETLDSTDARGSVYWRGDSASISADFEFRDFEFDIFRNDFVVGQNVNFHATGAGAAARFDLGDSLTLRLSGMDYNYNVRLNLEANQRILDLLSVSRLSLINTLIDYRAGISLGADLGRQQLNLDFDTSKGEVDGSTTRSTTLRWIAPLGNKNDIELSIGRDNSDTYGNVTFFSIFLYFYGG